MNILSNETKNGKVFKCSHCNAIHIEYKNLNFNFSKKQYKNFVNYILELDGEEWEYRNRNSNYRRKIIIPIGHKNFNVLINKEELLELKQLFKVTVPKKNVSNHFTVLNLNFTHFVN